jgi:signal transduction histidine kinase
MSEQDPLVIPREEFEKFLVALTHDIRNKLNSIALEAADLSEQADGQVDGSRLQQYVQEGSGFLKNVRQTLAPDDPNAEKMNLPEFIQQLRNHKYDS